MNIDTITKLIERYNTNININSIKITLNDINDIFSNYNIIILKVDNPDIVILVEFIEKYKTKLLILQIVNLDYDLFFKSVIKKYILYRNNNNKGEYYIIIPN